MSDYIERQKVVDAVIPAMVDGADAEIIEGLIYMIEPANVASVVFCKDCKHRDPEDKKCDCGHGILWQLPRDDNWFCADGKRREE